MAIVIIAGVRGGLDRGPYACLLLKSFCRGWCWNGQSKTTTADTDTPPRNQSIANPTAPHWTACCETKRPQPRRATMAWHGIVLYYIDTSVRIRSVPATRRAGTQLNSTRAVALPDVTRRVPHGNSGRNYTAVLLPRAEQRRPTVPEGTKEWWLARRGIPSVPG